jgi:hypothetical protein
MADNATVHVEDLLPVLAGGLAQLDSRRPF